MELVVNVSGVVEVFRRVGALQASLSCPEYRGVQIDEVGVRLGQRKLLFIGILILIDGNISLNFTSSAE